MENQNTVFYRYEFAIKGDMSGDTCYELILYKYNLVKETPKGYWIRTEHAYGDVVDVKKECHFVLKKSKKRFAYPTEKEALESFKKRKERQLDILYMQIRHCRVLLDMIEKGKKSSGHHLYHAAEYGIRRDL